MPRTTRGPLPRFSRPPGYFHSLCALTPKIQQLFDSLTPCQVMFRCFRGSAKAAGHAEERRPLARQAFPAAGAGMTTADADAAVVVTGAGGFIGGHLVARLLADGYTHVRAVDVKPFAEWYQRFQAAENLCLDLRRRDACDTA